MTLNPISPRRDLDAEDEVRQAVFVRDRWACVLWNPLWPLTRDGNRSEAPDCSGPITPHHRRKASSGGAWSLANLMTLCAGHNGWIEDEPDDARRLFPHLVIREGDPEWEELGRRAHRLG